MKNNKNTKSIALKFFLLAVLGSPSTLFSQNVGIGIVNPLQKLHIAGTASTIRIEGLATGGNFISAPVTNTDNLLFSNASGDIYKMPNGTSGQMPVINNSGTFSWSNAPVKYSVTGTSSAALSTVSAPITMPQMSITFTPKSSIVWVFFSAMGGSNVYEVPIQFQLRKNALPVIQFRASSEQSMGNQWVSSMSFPVSVTPGTPVTIDITWAEIAGFGNYQITNSAANPICRSLMILDL